jgi:hypothetical protein
MKGCINMLKRQLFWYREKKWKSASYYEIERVFDS